MVSTLTTNYAEALNHQQKASFQRRDQLKYIRNRPEDQDRLCLLSYFPILSFTSATTAAHYSRNQMPVKIINSSDVVFTLNLALQVRLSPSDGPTS